MLDAALSALAAFADPAMIGMLAIGAVAGLVMGLIPGLGGTGAVAVLLPFAFVLEPTQALTLIIGAVAVVHTSDTITAVLIGVPGSASAAVTLLDGHAMAKQGQAARALSLAFLSSMAGGILGAVGLTLSIPIARPLVLAFGSPELFMLTVLGISLTALLSRGNMLKGLLAGALGVLLGQVGGAPAAADYRFTFGSLFLTEGLDLVAVALGIFGLAEVIYLVSRGKAVSQVAGIGGGWGQGVRDFVTYWTHVLRGALVGVWAGVLPGVGATAGTWMAYGQAVAGSKDKSKFGKGDPRGIVGPESANNSVEAGDLIPTLLFGIPGGAPAALLMGALLLYGVEPGPRLITDHLDLVYTIVWAFALASIIGAALCFLLTSPLARLSRVRFPVLAGGLIVIMFVSAYQEPQQFGALQVMLLLGALGWLMKVSDIPRAPMLIGFVLSIPLERYYYLTTNLYSPSEMFFRPGVLIMLAILIAPLGFALYRRLRRTPSEKVSTTDGDAESPLARTWLPAILAGVMAVVFGAALVASAGFSERAALMPRIISVAGLVLSIVVVATDVTRRRRARAAPKAPDEPSSGTPAGDPADPAGGELVVATAGAAIATMTATATTVARTPNARVWRTELVPAAIALAWIALFLLLTYFFGTLVASLVFIPLFLRVVGRLAAWKIAVYTVVVLAALWVLHTYAEVLLPVGLYTPDVLR